MCKKKEQAQSGCEKKREERERRKKKDQTCVRAYLDLLVKSNDLISVAIHVIGIEMIVGPGDLTGGHPGVKCTDGGCATTMSTTQRREEREREERETKIK